MARRSLTEQAFAGAAWSGFGKFTSQAITFCGLLVIARRLGPNAYGLVGMARLITGFLDTFRDLGTTSAVIQRKEITNELLSSVFWANLIFALGAMLVSIATAPGLAAFYREPVTARIVYALSIGFILSGLGTVHSALLARDMAFHKVATIEMAAALAGSGVGVIAVFCGAGVWSLVFSSLVNQSTTSALLWIATRWKPKPILIWREVRSISGFSLNLSGFNIVNYVARNADNMIIGRVLGATQLGYYQLAYNIMLFPVMGVAHVLGRVLFPAFAKVQDDNVRFRQAYVKGAGMVSVVAFPVVTGMMCTAVPFIRLSLGETWIPVATLVAILGPVGLLQSMMATIGNLYFAKGRTDWLFRWGLFATAVYVTSFFCGVHWGVIGVATAYLMANILLFYPFFAFPFRLITLRVTVFLERLSPAFLISLGMYGAVLIYLHELDVRSVENPIFQFVSSAALGAMLYSTAMLLWKPMGLRDLLATGRSLLTAKQSAL